MKEINEQVEIANKLKKEIGEIKYFLLTVVRYDEGFTGIPSTSVVLKRRIDIQTSLFGSRYFGTGTHKQEISVPNCLRNNIVDFAENLLSEKQAQLSDLFKD